MIGVDTEVQGSISHAVPITFNKNPFIERKKLTTQLHLVLRSKNEWSYTSTHPIRPHGVVHS